MFPVLLELNIDMSDKQAHYYLCSHYHISYILKENIGVKSFSHDLIQDAKSHFSIIATSN